MHCINRVCLVGNVAQELCLGKTSSGTSVVNFTVTTKKSYVTQEGSSENKTDVHRVVAWGRLADAAVIQLSKGCIVFIEGELSHRDLVDKDGLKKTITEVVARTLLAGAIKPRNNEGNKKATTYMRSARGS